MRLEHLLSGVSARKLRFLPSEMSLALKTSMNEVIEKRSVPIEHLLVFSAAC